MLNHDGEANIGLEYVEFFLDIEREFRIELPDVETRRLETLRDVYSTIVVKTTGIAPAVDAPTAHDPVWQWLVGELETRFRIQRRFVRPETHLYRDLALG